MSGPRHLCRPRGPAGWLCRPSGLVFGPAGCVRQICRPSGLVSGSCLEGRSVALEGLCSGSCLSSRLSSILLSGHLCVCVAFSCSGPRAVSRSPVRQICRPSRLVSVPRSPVRQICRPSRLVSVPRSPVRQICRPSRLVSVPRSPVRARDISVPRADLSSRLSIVLLSGRSVALEGLCLCRVLLFGLLSVSGPRHLCRPSGPAGWLASILLSGHLCPAGLCLSSGLLSGLSV